MSPTSPQKADDPHHPIIQSDLFGGARPARCEPSGLPCDGLDKSTIEQWQKRFAKNHAKSLA
jgi:hypothetical protein